MRRAKFKVAPNVGAASRASQKLNPSNVSEAAEPVNDAKETPEISEATVTVAQPDQFQPVRAQVTAETSAPPVHLPKPTNTLSLQATPLLAAAIAAPALNFLDGCGVTSNLSTEKENQNGTALASGTESHGKELGPSGEHVQSASSAIHRFKHRAKIRPVLHDGPHRVRTISSTSESEDDARKMSRAPLSPIKKPAPFHDVLEPAEINEENILKASKKAKKREKTAHDLKKEALRRKLAKGNVDRSQLTMFDLIYYNPVEPDKPPRIQEKLQMRLKPYEAAALTEEKKKGKADGADILQERIDEEDEMRRMEKGEADDEGFKEPAEPATEANEEDEDHDEALPVPQVRVGPDGEIILDDTSLVIETTQAKQNKNALANAPVIIENSNTLVNYGSWSKRPRSARWSLKETARFYKALAMLGTNFSLMEKLFPNRPRVELKRKFKLEEKNNRQLVDKILAKQIPFDPSQFFDKEDQSESDGGKEKGKQTKKKSRKRKSATDEEPVSGAEIPTEEQESNGGETPPPSKLKRKRNYKSRSIVDSDSSEVNDVSEAEKDSSSTTTVELMLSPVQETRESDVEEPLSEQVACSSEENILDTVPPRAATPSRSEENQVINQIKDDGASSEEIPIAVKSKPKLKGRVKPNVSKAMKKTTRE